MLKFYSLSIFLILCPFLLCAQSATPQVSQQIVPQVVFNVDYEKFKLQNGLEVIFHIDRSDPVVAVVLTAHVGSAREKAGRTGFAHLFEHLLFLESVNLGKGGLDAMSARIGGSGANGSTNSDRTNYFQTVPKDALEKMLWAEADKLGWFISTVTDAVLAKEKEVVKNEKRQFIDNKPYGYTSGVIGKALYPADHPYNWQVIGSLEDLQNATLHDVKEFFNRWYVPNNVTLVVAGDFDKTQARQWVEKYFNEIKRGEEVLPLEKKPGVVERAVKLYHEDNFANVPKLTMTWPTVENYHPDVYPLEVLSEYLSKGKRAPFHQVLVEDEKLTSDVEISNFNAELAGEFHISVRAFADVDLNDVAKAINEAFGKFEKEGISQKDLERIKAGRETEFYKSLSSVMGKGFLLAQYNIFTGDPGFFDKNIKNLLAVSTADVVRVYNKYIRARNYVSTSFVPKGKLALVLEGSKKADIVEEKIVQGTEEKINPSSPAIYQRTPSSFDRTMEPPYGPAAEVKIPAIWSQQLANGLRVYGIEYAEVPLVEFDIVIDGGLLLEDTGKVGVANMMARMLTQGTKNKTPLELEEAIQHLGATVNIFASTEDIRMRVTTLARNYSPTLALVEEILLKPRWDAKEFDLIKQSIISHIRQEEADPNSIAENNYNLLIYGKDNIRSSSILGTIESVRAITVEDLKAFYNKSISPSVTRMHIVGGINKATIASSLYRLGTAWRSKTVTIRAWETPNAPTKPVIYFYDVPDAKQSVIRFGYPAVAATDRNYYPATVMNFSLGGGGFASRLVQQLRENKGYTYGIGSIFSGTKTRGPFTIASSVRTNVTLESAQLIKSILETYCNNYSSADLETTKSSLTKSNARGLETAKAKLNMLENISKYGWEYDYIKQRQQVLKGMTVEQVKDLCQRYLDVNKMIWLVVGDAKTQLPRLKDLGFGDPVLISKQSAF